MPSSRSRDASRARIGPTCSWHHTSADVRSILAQTPCWTRARNGWAGVSGSCGGTHPQELQEKLVAELVEALGLAGPDDELAFEESLGGARHGDIPWAFFWNRFGDNPGAAARAEAWQMLSPVRAGPVGVDALNRMLQTRFRAKVRELAETEGWGRKVPRPVGPQTLLYGDKVINVINQRRRDVWPKPAGEAYLANGDIGIVVGQYKTKKLKGLPRKLEVEFAGQLGPKYGFYAGEFGDEGRNPLELAYCLTVHKTQGSEFGVTFVVLTNPCWLLSRELLYTALTRHKGPVGHPARGSAWRVSPLCRRRALGDRPAHDEPLCGSAAARRNRQRPATLPRGRTDSSNRAR